MYRLFALLAIFVSLIQGATIYSSIPPVLPPNLPSLGYQATQTAEFGGLIQFAGTYRDLNTVTVVLSDWALPGPQDGATWTHDLTLNLYEVDNTTATPAVGSLIESRTVTATIPFRPAADPSCGTAWKAGDGNCYNGLAFTVDFDFTGVTVPDSLIYGLAFNTQTWGANPIGANGPYNSLNFALATANPSVGSNPLPNTVFWKTATAAWYTDGGAAGVNVFRLDTDWQPYTGPAISFDATGIPEPATFGLIGSGLVAAALLRRRHRS